MSSSKTAVTTSRPTQPPALLLGVGGSSNDVPLVNLRVQIISCHDLEPKDFNGFSDPFVVVSIFGKERKTPVYKRNLNPVYKSKDATFEFPISMSLVQTFGSLKLKFVVWDKDMIGKDFLGKNALSINEWFKGTAIAFDDPNNKPIQVKLLSSPTIKITRGTMSVKLGFTHHPDSTSKPDFRNIYNTLRLANPVLAPQADHVGIVTLLIGGAKNLPEWPNVAHMGWDMDPYVEVTIGEEVKRTCVIQHNLNPVWDKQMVFHVRKSDLSRPILLSVFDKDRISSDDHVGDTKVSISELRATSKKDRTIEFYFDDLLAMHEFKEVPLNMNKKRKYKCTPTITFHAGYQSYDDLRKQVGQCL